MVVHVRHADYIENLVSRFFSIPCNCVALCDMQCGRPVLTIFCSLVLLCHWLLGGVRVTRLFGGLTKCTASRPYSSLTQEMRRIRPVLVILAIQQEHINNPRDVFSFLFEPSGVGGRMRLDCTESRGALSNRNPQYCSPHFSQALRRHPPLR
ncbi:hypothetical protein F5Y12DRAFT_477321 [Xylaria sp. FL1777]|nr:hypothetical protein F5Y12DRAFT_477321 [Xylaria sp. FL1777]